MFFIFNKYFKLRRKTLITLLNPEWEVVKANLFVYSIPRINELVCLGDKYYSVVNVVHNMAENHGIFVIVEENSSIAKKSL